MQAKLSLLCQMISIYFSSTVLYHTRPEKKMRNVNFVHKQKPFSGFEMLYPFTLFSCDFCQKEQFRITILESRTMERGKGENCHGV